MKKFLPFLLAIMLSGCMVYGKGETVGYVYAVDDGIIWDKVWYKSSLESSQSDCYLIKDETMKAQLRDITGKKKIKMTYKKHLTTVATCDNNTQDEIVSFETL